MNNTFLRLMILSCLLICSSQGFTVARASAATANEEQLIIETKLLNEGQIYANQPVTVSITVLTSRWFSKGTRLGSIEIPDAVVLPTGEYAINGTRKINYKTWTTQTRDITFYPVAAGVMMVPSIALDVSVNSASGESVDTVLYSEPIEILVELPEGIAPDQDYLVSENFSVNIEELEAAKSEYTVGDAITQTFTFVIEGTPGMMLPQLPKIELEGMSVYQKPAKLLDKTDRGIITGVREESFTYFFEAAGEYTLPEQTFYWFNTQFNTVETITIPEYHWTVIGKSGVEKVIDDISNFDFSVTNAVYIILFATGVLLIGFIIIKNRSAIMVLYKTVSKQQQRHLNSQFLTAIKQQKYRTACHYLYQRYGIKPEGISPEEPKQLRELFSHDAQQLSTLEALFALAFNNTPDKPPTTITLQQAKTLISSRKNNFKRKTSDDDDYSMADFINLNNRSD